MNIDVMDHSLNWFGTKVNSTPCCDRELHQRYILCHHISVIFIKLLSTAIAKLYVDALIK